jgi:cytidylate kinase/aminoglycoside phosphotransferase (APT) family kinase protein
LFAGVTPEIVAVAVEGITGALPTAVIELAPRGTLRSFRAEGPQPMTLRVDEDPASRRVDVEALAFVALQTATEVPVVPTLRTRHVLAGRDGIERRFLVYDWIAGHVLDSVPQNRAKDLGALIAQLHGARVMDLQGRLQDGPMSLLDAYRRTGEALRAWVAMREADGLSHDLLTLSLSDLQRGLRTAIVADDNAFRTARRRVLCHGALEPALFVARDLRSPLLPSLCMVGLDKAHLGDAAFDLARFAVVSDLDDDTEDLLLNSYLDTLIALDRRDPRFVGRYFAARTLEVLARPMARLELITRIKQGKQAVIEDAVDVLERESELVVKEVAAAINALRDISGRTRAVGVAEVKAMGRVVVVEDLVLAGRTFRLALNGEPYTGKTEVGALLAQRLRHHFVSTATLSRALALIERQHKQRAFDIDVTRPIHPEDLPDLTKPRALVASLFERGFVMEPTNEPPFYRVRLNDEDITAQLKDADGELLVRAGALLDDDAVRTAIRDELERRTSGGGIVVEGPHAERLLGARVRAFHLVGDQAVRLARLMAHRADVASEADAATMLARLDASSPKRPQEAIAVDVGSRPAAAAALAVLVHLLPPGRRPALDLSGRQPL